MGGGARVGGERSERGRMAELLLLLVSGGLLGCVALSSPHTAMPPCSCSPPPVVATWLCTPADLHSLLSLPSFPTLLPSLPQRHSRSPFFSPHLPPLPSAPLRGVHWRAQSLLLLLSTPSTTVQCASDSTASCPAPPSERCCRVRPRTLCPTSSPTDRLRALSMSLSHPSALCAAGLAEGGDSGGGLGGDMTKSFQQEFDAYCKMSKKNVRSAQQTTHSSRTRTRHTPASHSSPLHLLCPLCVHMCSACEASLAASRWAGSSLPAYTHSAHRRSRELPPQPPSAPLLLTPPLSTVPCPSLPVAVSLCSLCRV